MKLNQFIEANIEQIVADWEAFARTPKLAMLWSVGKDSNVLIWLARKAF